MSEYESGCKESAACAIMEWTLHELAEIGMPSSDHARAQNENSIIHSLSHGLMAKLFVYSLVLICCTCRTTSAVRSGKLAKTENSFSGERGLERGHHDVMPRVWQDCKAEGRPNFGKSLGRLCDVLMKSCIRKVFEKYIRVEILPIIPCCSLNCRRCSDAYQRL